MLIPGLPRGSGHPFRNPQCRWKLAFPGRLTQGTGQPTRPGLTVQAVAKISLSFRMRSWRRFASSRLWPVTSPEPNGEPGERNTLASEKPLSQVRAPGQVLARQNAPGASFPRVTQSLVRGLTGYPLNPAPKRQSHASPGQRPGGGEKKGKHVPCNG